MHGRAPWPGGGATKEKEIACAAEQVPLKEAAELYCENTTPRRGGQTKRRGATLKLLPLGETLAFIRRRIRSISVLRWGGIYGRRGVIGGAPVVAWCAAGVPAHAAVDASCAGIIPVSNILG